MKDSYNELTYEELWKKRNELKKRFMDIRFDKVVGHMENPLEKRTVRKKIARVNTLIHEYDLGVRKSQE